MSKAEKRTTDWQRSNETKENVYKEGNWLMTNRCAVMTQQYTGGN